MKPTPEPSAEASRADIRSGIPPVSPGSPHIFWPLTAVLVASLLAVGWMILVVEEPAPPPAAPAPAAAP